MLILLKGDETLTKATTIILAIIVASVFAVGANNVYGTEVTVELDTDKYDVETQLCNEGTSTGDWWCNWQKLPNTSGYTGNQTNADTGDIPIWWDDETKSYIPDEVHTAEAIADCKEDLTCPSGNYEMPDGTVVDLDEEIAKSQNTPDELPDEGVFKCGYDISLWQDGSQFEAPIEIWIDSDGNKNVRLVDNNLIETDNQTTPSDLAVEACFAQWELEKREKITGEEGTTITMVDNSNEIQIYHSDAAFGIPPIGQAQVNERANVGFSNTSIKNTICNGYIDNNYKKEYGCFDDDEVPQGDEPKPLTNLIPESIESKIEQYNRDGGAAMAKQLQKEHITDKLLALQKQLRSLN